VYHPPCPIPHRFVHLGLLIPYIELNKCMHRAHRFGHNGDLAIENDRIHVRPFIQFTRRDSAMYRDHQFLGELVAGKNLLLDDTQLSSSEISRPGNQGLVHAT
jgi:hypothetical protein